MTEMKKGVLVGGSGLIGGTIVNYYKKYPDLAVDIRAPSSKKLSIRVSEDICDYIRQVKPDFIINAAMANLGADGKLSCEVNYLGAINLARAALSLGIPLIHISSSATLPAGENLSEDDTVPLTPGLSNYAKSKLMAEITLKKMAQEQGLDYTCIRLAIVYGAHDHKIQGFHRMFFSIADESMPVLFTKKNTLHSYSNSRKLPYFIDYIIGKRNEFSGQTYHFVDPDAVDLATLILKVKSYLNLNKPREIYAPFWLANLGTKSLNVMLRVLRQVGLQASMPPELMFLENFYKPQTLSAKKLQDSSFIDPFPGETVFTRLPDLVVYYITRWDHENLIMGFKECFDTEKSLESIFYDNPIDLVEEVHKEGVGPYEQLTQS